MNLPNKLTLLRIILIPPIAALLLYSGMDGWWCWLLAGLLFGAASITDALDGSIARKRGLVTDFGKLMDPVADKLLVTAVFICFIARGLCSPWVLIIVLLREFLVTSIRMVAVDKGRVIPANMWGKVKTVIQIVAILVVICSQLTQSLLGWLDIAVEPFPYCLTLCEQGVLWLSALATLLSGAVYCAQSRELFLNA